MQVIPGEMVLVQALGIGSVGSNVVAGTNGAISFADPVNGTVTLASLATGGSGGTLQQAWNKGPTVVVTTGVPLAINNAAGVASGSGILSILDLTAASNANFDIVVSCTANTTGAVSYSGSAIIVNYQPVSKVGLMTVSETLLSLNYTPSLSGGTSLETAIGAFVNMSPATAVSVVTGLQINLNANASNAAGAVGVLQACCFEMQMTAANRGTTPFMILGSTLGLANPKSIFCNVGAPSNTNGNNGDLYIRTDDSSATTTFYKKAAGAWAAIA